MSNLSVKYNQAEPTPAITTQISRPEEVQMYFSVGVTPANFFELSKNSNFRDVVISTLVSEVTGNETDNVLNTLCKWARILPDHDDDLPVVGEYITSLAFAWGYSDLVKETLLRIPPTRVTKMLKTVYVAMVERNMSPEYFSAMLLNSRDAAVAAYELNI